MRPPFILLFTIFSIAASFGCWSQSVVTYKGADNVYEFKLEGEQQQFRVDTLLHRFDSKIQLVFRNNTGEIIYPEGIYCDSRGQCDLNGGRGKPFQPGELVKVSWSPEFQTTTSLRTSIRITFRKKGELIKTVLGVKGFIRGRSLPDSEYPLLELRTVANTPSKTITYTEASKIDDYPLTGQNLTFDFKTQQRFPSDYQFRIVNNTGKAIEFKEVRESEAGVRFYVKTASGWALRYPKDRILAADSSILVRGFGEGAKSEQINLHLLVCYTVDDANFVKAIRIKGMTGVEPVENTPVQVATNTPKATVKEPTVPVKETVKTQEATNRKFLWDGDIVIGSRKPNVFEYHLSLSENTKEHAFNIRTFSWDTIRPGDSMVLRFRIKNDTDHTIYKYEIVDAYGSPNHFLVENSQVPVDSFIVVESVIHPKSAGVIRDNFRIKYDLAYEFILREVGYCIKDTSSIAEKQAVERYEAAQTKRAAIHQQTLIDSIRVYPIQDEWYLKGEQQVRMADTKQFLKPSKDENGLTYYSLPRATDGSAYLEAWSPVKGVLAKTFVPYNHPHPSWPFYIGSPDTNKPVWYPYDRGVRNDSPVMDNLYALRELDWGRWKELNKILGPDSVYRTNSKISGLLYIPDPAKAAALERRLLQLANPIVLFPVIDFSKKRYEAGNIPERRRINGYKGNLNYHYFRKEVTVYFRDVQSAGNVDKLFAKYGITTYDRDPRNPNGESFIISFKFVADGQYKEVLNKLYQHKEITMIHEETIHVPAWN